MGIFKGADAEAVLFSPLEGKLTFEGKPAAGATLKVWIKWDDPEGSTETFTADEAGFFSLPRKTGHYKDNPLVELVITQEITASYQGQDFLIWTASKSNTHEYGELGGKPVGLTCELTGDMRGIRTDEVLMGTVCTWDSLDSTGVNNE
ncbi:DUF6795 domain-containing protein [Gilvimarinus sp. F26214L]|uniref:DUF6795 domain-containing protein n=1 Tax=Gilvimarinus sp. DZF01 TaxID=3461371 RepID=UPI0040456A76